MPIARVRSGRCRVSEGGEPSFLEVGHIHLIRLELGFLPGPLLRFLAGQLFEEPVAHAGQQKPLM